MKKLLLLVALLASATALPASADEISGSLGNVRLALTLTTEVPGTFERDENGKFIKDPVTNQKIPKSSNFWQIIKGAQVTGFREESVKALRVKYGTKELLLDLLEAGILPDTGIQGWTVKFLVVGSASEPSFGLVKKGEPFVSIDDHFNLAAFSDVEDGPAVQFTTTKQLFTGSGAGEELTLVKVNGQAQGEALTGFIMDIDGIGGKLYGPASVTQKGILSKSGKPVFTVKLSMPVMMGQFMTPGGPAFVKGSLQVSPGMVINDLTSLGIVVNDPSPIEDEP